MNDRFTATKSQLRRFQQMNCIGCRFADDHAINLVKACCTKPTPPEVIKDLCMDKKSRTNRR